MGRAAWILAVLTAWADTYPRQPGIDIQHYAFRIGLSDTTDEIRGEARIDFRVLNTKELFLDLGSAMTIDGISSGPSPLPYEHQAGRLHIPLPTAETHQSITVRYHGVPAGGLRIGPNMYGDRTFFSTNWPDLGRQWLPMVDHPYDKATSEFIVTAPSHYQVVANGLLQEQTDLRDGHRRTHWKQGIPIASWLNAIAIAQFSVRHIGTQKGIELTNWVYPQDREKGIAAFDIPTRNAFEFFSEYIGPYPYEKLANVQAAGLIGGTEHASVIFYGEKSISARPANTLVSHEIAHQWFGNSVTESDWDDVWLSEGFATYFALLYTEHFEGRDAFAAGLKRSRATVIASEEKNPNSPVIHRNLADTKKVLNLRVYEKGAWILHMLRGLAGPEKFRAAIRDYYQRFRGGNVATADFQRIMEEHTGLSLGWFVEQWLQRPGLPVIAGSWHYDAAARQIQVSLHQSQSGPVFRLPIEFGIGADRIEKMEMSTRDATFTFPAEREPAAVRLDPNTLLLANITFPTVPAKP